MGQTIPPLSTALSVQEALKECQQTLAMQGWSPSDVRDLEVLEPQDVQVKSPRCVIKTLQLAWKYCPPTKRSRHDAISCPVQAVEDAVEAAEEQPQRPQHMYRWQPGKRMIDRTEGAQAAEDVTEAVDEQLQRPHQFFRWHSSKRAVDCSEQGLVYGARVGLSRECGWENMPKAFW